jgi:hypothetical protein
VGIQWIATTVDSTTKSPMVVIHYDYERIT